MILFLHITRNQNCCSKMKNIEIKAKVNDVEKLLEKSKYLSRTEGNALKQHDTFYNVNMGRLKLRRFEDGSGELIYYERSDTEGPKLCSYEKANIAAENVHCLESVLHKALGAKTVVKKHRQVFLVGETRIHIDSVEGLGDFMELEVVLGPEQSLEDGENIAFQLMRELGIGKEDLVCGAYADLLNK